MPGVPVKAVGMKNIPAVAQSEHLEEATVMNPERIEAAARSLLAASGAAAHSAPAGWSWIPSRYIIG
jgi:hypothetical protein